MYPEKWCIITLLPFSAFLQDVNCRQYYKGNPEANAKAYSGLAVSLGTGGDTTVDGSIVTPPVLTTGSVTETTTLLTVEPKVVLLTWCITCVSDTVLLPSVEFWASIICLMVFEPSS